MTIAPVLAVTSYRDRVPMIFEVAGGLRFIKGNQKPYFVLTYTAHRKGFPNQCWAGGAGHEEILKRFPQFADLAALHLSDIDGVPMHAEANGWYDLAGALPDNAGAQYHVGNSQRHFPKPVGAPRKHDWDNTDYRNPTPEECLQIFADHVRVDLETARAVRDMVTQAAIEGATAKRDQNELVEALSGVRQQVGRYDWKAGRQAFAAWIQAQHPRWKMEADACIKKHGLVVYGDP